MENVEEWAAWRDKEDDRLYEAYGKPLEAEHKGELVAIGPNGETILGIDDAALADIALERFGSGQFCLRRIGYDWDIRIRGLYK